MNTVFHAQCRKNMQLGYAQSRNVVADKTLEKAMQINNNFIVLAYRFAQKFSSFLILIRFVQSAY